MNEQLHIQMTTSLRLFEPRGAQRLFDAIEQNAEIAPTHWGESASLRDPYDRAHILAYMRQCQEAGADGESLVLRRLEPPRYNLTMPASYQSMMWIRLESSVKLEPESLPLYFALGTRLAPAVRAEYGFVDIFDHEDGDLPGEKGWQPFYPERGPDGIRRRTFFGLRLLELMGGAQAFEGSGLLVRPFDGGVEADIVEPAWSAPKTEVRTKQRAAMASLRETGVFGTYDEKKRYTTGPRWIPMPPTPRQLHS
ncbi:hypothetical protein LVJ94_17510 [Pendulispora rubella]|uniref:Uncharacterized protein n=1 Tax=Pendulispora rubella TaxID=2741070 RepID=A0ABZ2LE25_9BACT